MIFDFWRREGEERLRKVEEKVQAMLRHGRQEFDLAMAALLGEADARQVNAELRDMDREVNRLEREIRRELLVHASVFGGIDTPAVLIYMSIVKDIERVGDYAKNLIDLALDGADFSKVRDAAEWHDFAREISQYIAEAGDAFQARDNVRGRALHARGDVFLDRFDERVSAMVRGDDHETQAVARALACRYLKRVVAHLMNMLSAVTMPFDRLDFFDEDPEDRSKR